MLKTLSRRRALSAIVTIGVGLSVLLPKLSFAQG
jgi:hypothetical protein